MAKIYHVAKNGCDSWAGTEERPFLTIRHAASIAMPADTVIVHEGVYREWVSPRNSGISEHERITYRAAEREKVVIRGSEQITGWENVSGTVWKVTLPNAMFGDWNPYAIYCYGDWMIRPPYPTKHLGDVYLNGKSFFEALSVEEVEKAEMRTTGHNYPWSSGHLEPILNAEDTVYCWYAQVDDETTTIWANFQGADPNAELVEINVRKCCFYPEQTGCDYITVSGFEMAQAATPFAPPTGDQPGIIGPHWSKGWIIENCFIHDSKCCGISLGKDEKTGDNLFTRTRRKPGYTYQYEAVGKALTMGWSKERIGSHIVRNNVICDCGQNGIVGHLGCVFSEISGNEIYRIATKHEFFGWEIGGIKLHAPLDTQIHHNYVHHCTMGMWFDWQTQGTRISANLFTDNSRDLMVEVSHGPYLVDNNILTSPYSFENASQGGAYVHNLIMGNTLHWTVLDRSTPYHFPHSTAIMASSFIYGGDDRFYQNILVGGADDYGVSDRRYGGTEMYNGHPASFEEYIQNIQDAFPGDVQLYAQVKQAVYIDRNVYAGGAPGYDREEHACHTDAAFDVKVVKEDGRVWLEIFADAEALSLPMQLMATEDLGFARAVEGRFEAPNGEDIIFDTDYCGSRRSAGDILPGPINTLKPGMNRIRVW